MGRRPLCRRSARLQKTDLRNALRRSQRGLRAVRHVLRRRAHPSGRDRIGPVTIHIIGGGLAGCEAAWQIARRGHNCMLHEMRPARPTPAHQTDKLAELVCSNSLKSESESTAPWLLKEELRRLDSLLLTCAQTARVPGGHALTVDRDIFASAVTAAIGAEPRIELRRGEVTSLAEDAIWIVASGPLTSGALAGEIARL